MLPRGHREVGFDFEIAQETVDPVSLTYGTLAIGGRFSTGTIEPFAGIVLLPMHWDPPGTSLDIPPLQRVYAGTSVSLPQDSLVGVEGVVGSVGSDFQYYSPSLFVSHKFHLFDQGAFVLGGGTNYILQNKSHRFGAYAQGNAEVQLTPLVALQVHAGLAGYKYRDADSNESFSSYSYGASLVFSASETVDLVPYVGRSVYGVTHTWDAGLSIGVR